MEGFLQKKEKNIECWVKKIEYFPYHFALKNLKELQVHSNPGAGKLRSMTL